MIDSLVTMTVGGAVAYMLWKLPSKMPSHSTNIEHCVFVPPENVADWRPITVNKDRTTIYGGR